LTEHEIEVLRKEAADIAKRIQPGSMVIELGSGFVLEKLPQPGQLCRKALTLRSNLRKVSILLEAIDAANKYVDYYALDLSLAELERTLAAVPDFKFVRCHGLHGTYDDGLHWIKQHENASRPKCIMSLGSSIGNFHKDSAAEFLKGFAEALRYGDTMLIGLDACDDAVKV
jgi:uncharacterized SAM-dependent methyltransferase